MQQARNILLPLILASGSLLFSSGGYGAETAKSSYASEIVKDVREDKVYLLENIRRDITKPSERILVEALLTEDGPKAAGLYRKQLTEYPDPQLDDISRSRLVACERALAGTAKPVLIAPKPGAPKATVALVRPPANLTMKADTVSRQVPAPAPSRPVAVTVTPATRTTIYTDQADPALLQPKTTAPKPATAASTPTQTPPTSPRALAPVAQNPSGEGTYTLQFGSFDNATNANQLSAQLSSSSPAKVVEIRGVYKVRLKKTFATREEAGAFRRSLPIESFVVTDQP